MLHHIVMLKLKDFAEGKSGKENAELIKDKLEALKTKIPEIKRIEVGLNMDSSEYSNYDLVLDTYFENYDELKTYQIHPEHKKVAEFVAKVRDLRAAVDYEM